MQILSPKRRIDILRDAMDAKSRGQPYCITFCGVNGVGKSTNLSKVTVFGSCLANIPFHEKMILAYKRFCTLPWCSQLVFFHCCPSAEALYVIWGILALIEHILAVIENVLAVIESILAVLGSILAVIGSFLADREWTDCVDSSL